MSVVVAVGDACGVVYENEEIEWIYAREDGTCAGTIDLNDIFVEWISPDGRDAREVLEMTFRAINASLKVPFPYGAEPRCQYTDYQRRIVELRSADNTGL